MNPDIQKIVAAAKAGGAVLKTYFGQSLETTQKSTLSDFRTKADLESEEAIVGMLINDFPSYNIHSEEMGKVDKQSAYTFVIDPLDGTNNFVLGIPNFSVSIGLMKNEEIVMGVIYTPMIDQVYWAVKGQGAFLDQQRLQVNTESDIKKSSLSYNCSYAMSYTDQTKVIDRLYGKDAKRVTTNWAPTFDFCLLASGRIEGIVVNDIELHDFSAGKLIVREAGGMITDYVGQPEPNDKNQIFLMSNGTTIHQELIRAVA